MYPDTGYQCHKCGMRFAVVSYFQTKGEVTWCAEPKCKVRFWHGYAGHEMGQRMKPCEVLQADLERAHG